VGSVCKRNTRPDDKVVEELTLLGGEMLRRNAQLLHPHGDNGIVEALDIFRGRRRC
jgi:hypothetical protein